MKKIIVRKIMSVVILVIVTAGFAFAKVMQYIDANAQNDQYLFGTHNQIMT
jgi:hypothetical protein